MSSLIFFYGASCNNETRKQKFENEYPFSKSIFYGASKQLVEYFLMTVEYYMALLVRGMPLFL